MKLPKPGTMVVLFGEPEWIRNVAEHHGWLFKYLCYDINPDMVHLTSIATGDKVYISRDNFKMWFKEMANAS